MRSSFCFNRWEREHQFQLRTPHPGSFLDLDMTIPTEPIGSIPRPQKLITAFAQYERGSLSQEEFQSICSEAVRETIEKFEGLGAKNWGASQAGLSGERGQNEVYPVREGRGK